MDEQQKESLRRTYDTYDNEKLLEIWRSQSSAEWTSDAVAIAGDILKNRLGELPSQELETESDDEDDALDEVFDERLYNIRALQKAARWSHHLATTFIILIGMQIIATILDVFERGTDILNILFSVLTYSLSSLLLSVGGFVLFTGFSAGLQVLADIAGNTRNSEKYLSKISVRK
jgi:hypothetical protein